MTEDAPLAISYPVIAPPTRLGSLVELRTPLDLLVSARHWLNLPHATSAAGRTVLLVPAFGAREWTMAPIGRLLRRLGHRPRGWGLGRNTGNVRALLAGLDERTERLVQEAGEPIVAVGWSLGGYLIREIARDRPERFRKLVTLGSPVVGGPKYTVTARSYRERGFDVDEIERTVAARFEVPLTVPVAAIYSKRDGIVAWEACIDRWSPHVRHIQVSETHFGLGISPRTLPIVAEEVGALARGHPAPANASA